MLDVIFTICALANPTDCKELRAKTELEDTQFVACLINAEQTLAQYMTKDYFVKSFGCTRKSKDS
jgi:hypothetical protein